MREDLREKLRQRCQENAAKSQREEERKIPQPVDRDLTVEPPENEKPVLYVGNRGVPLPPWTTPILKLWFTEHLSYPYPCLDEKRELGARTRLSVKQVESWFAHARRRQRMRMRKEEIETMRPTGGATQNANESSDEEQSSIAKQQKRPVSLPLPTAIPPGPQWTQAVAPSIQSSHSISNTELPLLAQELLPTLTSRSQLPHPVPELPVAPSYWDTGAPVASPCSLEVQSVMCKAPAPDIPKPPLVESLLNQLTDPQLHHFSQSVPATTIAPKPTFSAFRNLTQYAGSSHGGPVPGDQYPVAYPDPGLHCGATSAGIPVTQLSAMSLSSRPFYSTLPSRLSHSTMGMMNSGAHYSAQVPYPTMYPAQAPSSSLYRGMDILSSTPYMYWPRQYPHLQSFPRSPYEPAYSASPHTYQQQEANPYSNQYGHNIQDYQATSTYPYSMWPGPGRQQTHHPTASYVDCANPAAAHNVHSQGLPMFAKLHNNWDARNGVPPNSSNPTASTQTSAFTNLMLNPENEGEILIDPERVLVKVLGSPADEQISGPKVAIEVLSETSSVRSPLSNHYSADMSDINVRDDDVPNIPGDIIPNCVHHDSSLVYGASGNIQDTKVRNGIVDEINVVRGRYTRKRLSDSNVSMPKPCDGMVKVEESRYQRKHLAPFISSVHGVIPSTDNDYVTSAASGVDDHKSTLSGTSASEISSGKNETPGFATVSWFGGFKDARSPAQFWQQPNQVGSTPPPAIPQNVASLPLPKIIKKEPLNMSNSSLSPDNVKKCAMPGRGSQKDTNFYWYTNKWRNAFSGAPPNKSILDLTRNSSAAKSDPHPLGMTNNSATVNLIQQAIQQASVNNANGKKESQSVSGEATRQNQTSPTCRHDNFESSCSSISEDDVEQKETFFDLMESCDNPPCVNPFVGEGKTACMGSELTSSSGACTSSVGSDDSDCTDSDSAFIPIAVQQNLCGEPGCVKETDFDDSPLPEEQNYAGGTTNHWPTTFPATSHEKRGLYLIASLNKSPYFLAFSVLHDGGCPPRCLLPAGQEIKSERVEGGESSHQRAASALLRLSRQSPEGAICGIQSERSPRRHAAV